MQGFLRKRWVCVILAIAVAGSILVGYLSDITYSEAQFVTPQSIVQEFDENDAAAEFKYVDKEVVVTGIVSSLGDSDVMAVGTRFMINLHDEQSDSPYHYVECYFAGTRDELPEVASVQVGQKLTIKGTFVGNGATPMMAACAIVSQ